MLQPITFHTKTTSHCIQKDPTAVELPHIIQTPPEDLSNGSKKITSKDPLNGFKESPLTLSNSELRNFNLQNKPTTQRLIDDADIKFIKNCCGENCCIIADKTFEGDLEQVNQPDNLAYRSLRLNIKYIPKNLSGLPNIPPKNISFLPIENDVSYAPSESLATQNSVGSMKLTTKASNATDMTSADAFTTSYSNDHTSIHPPDFVQPHAPYNIFSARIFSARELTRPGAEKRTYHFDLDVNDYPYEMGVDFKVGGAIGVSAPNESSIVEEFLDLLCIPRYLRGRPVLLKTTSGRWPTVWGDDMPRELVTTRRDLVTWCTDLQSSPPSKSVLRLLAEHASVESEKKILLFLISNQGQSTFCDLRTGPYITMLQLLHAFPSCKPPLDALLSILPQLAPRWYSLSSDPHEASDTGEASNLQEANVPNIGRRKLIEVAVTIQEHPNWDGSIRVGVGSGFFERQAKKFIEAERQGIKPDIRVPMFKGLMANPLAREFSSDGPMLLVGAGVGIAPFRGFVQRRLRNASCVNKVWVLQGIRDSLLDELYGGEWGVHENEVKKVVQSRQRSSQSKYVQDEVRAQADLVWLIINSQDGRIFVCGSSCGMSAGVQKALVDVAMLKGNLDEENATEFWESKIKTGQYIVEAWS